MSAALSVAARVVLAVTLAFAAAGKLARPEAGARRAVPFAELAVGAALVAWRDSPLPGVVAAALLAVFTVVLARAIATHVPCACFGARVGAAPARTIALVRNALLLALAVLATGDATGAGVGRSVLWTFVFAVPVVVLVRASEAPA